MSAPRSIRAAFSPTNKKINSQHIFAKLLRQASPISMLSKMCGNRSNSKNKGKLQIVSTRYTSPSSCQSSSLISKKVSREKKDTFNKNSKNVNTSMRPMKKKKKNKSLKNQTKQNFKQNSINKMNVKGSQQFKNTKWKNKVLKQFIVKSRKNTEHNHSIICLQNSLRLYSTEETFKQNSSCSFLGYLHSEYDEGAKKTTLLGAKRIIIIDWMFLIGTSMLLNRDTLHLAVHYMDSFLCEKQQTTQQIHIIAAASLFLSVKQEQRQMQSILLQTLCRSEQFNVLKDQVIECQRNILTKLNYRLKRNTLAFWIDYFATKWDSFIGSVQGEQAMHQANFQMKVKIRSSDGDGYKTYRELIQLGDVSLMFGEYGIFHKSKLSLACIYLVIRIQAEKDYQKDQNQDLFKNYHKLFLKKASPIFKDPFRINQIFNTFLTQVCQFQITEIIPCIKFIANFLQMDFCYNIDEQALDQTKSYEDFIRRMTYSYQMKEYCLQKIK